jgi:cell division septation protein DedD
MKISYKHLILLTVVLLALVSLCLPMLWEKNLYPKHLLFHRRAVTEPKANISQIPAFTPIVLHQRAITESTAWMLEITNVPDLATAQKLQTQLRSQGYASFLSSTLEKPGQIYLDVGPYSQKELAEKTQEILHQQLNLAVTVIPYNPSTIQEISG